MQLVIILLITVSVLTILSGAIVFFGTKKGDRARSFWFFIATLFATIWIISICCFMTIKEGSEELMTWHANWTYISAIFIDVALLGYISWHEKYGKYVVPLFLMSGLVLTTLFAINPDFLYTGIILNNNSSNGLVTNIGPFYFVYIAYFCLLISTVIFTLVKQSVAARSIKKRSGELVLLIGFVISGTMALVFDLILPFWDWSLVWLGPLAISTTIIAFYYSILRYKVLQLDSVWLRILSYIVIITSMAIIYMIIFSLVFALLFKGSAPSTEVIILNFIMITIFLLFMPAINEVMTFTRSLISKRSTKPKDKGP